MKEELLLVKIDDDKLWVSSSAGEGGEFYLPDCREEQVREFLHRHVDELARVLAKERPWRLMNETRRIADCKEVEGTRTT